MANKIKTPERGAFLTIMLVLTAFGILTSLYILSNTDSVAKTYGSVPEWYLPYFTFGIILTVAYLVGLWTWKKWAVYLLFGYTAVALLIQLFVLKPVASVSGLSYFGSLIMTGLWFWAIYRKWQYFE